MREEGIRHNWGRSRCGSSLLGRQRTARARCARALRALRCALRARSALRARIVAGGGRGWSLRPVTPGGVGHFFKKIPSPPDWFSFSLSACAAISYNAYAAVNFGLICDFFVFFVCGVIFSYIIYARSFFIYYLCSNFICIIDWK